MVHNTAQLAQASFLYQDIKFPYFLGIVLEIVKTSYHFQTYFGKFFFFIVFGFLFLIVSTNIQITNKLINFLYITNKIFSAFYNQS